FPTRPIRWRSSPGAPGGTAPGIASLVESPGDLSKSAGCATKPRSHAAGRATRLSESTCPACLAADRSVFPQSLLACLGERISTLLDCQGEPGRDLSSLPPLPARHTRLNLRRLVLPATRSTRHSTWRARPHAHGRCIGREILRGSLSQSTHLADDGSK